MEFCINVQSNNKKEVFLNLKAVQNNFAFDFKNLAMMRNQVENLHLFTKRYCGRIMKTGEQIAFKLVSDKGAKVAIRFIYDFDFKGNKLLRLFVESECIKCAMNVDREDMIDFNHDLGKIVKLFEKKSVLGFNNMQLKMLLI